MDSRVTCEVGYNVGDGIFSVNMIEGREFTSCRNEAVAHAKKHGYEVSYIREIPDWKIAENLHKHMPLIKV